MRLSLVLVAIGLFGLSSTAHANRYFAEIQRQESERIRTRAEQEAAKRQQALLNAQMRRDESSRRDTTTVRQRNERNNRFARSIRAAVVPTSTMKPYSSQAVAAGTRSFRTERRVMIPLAVRLGGSRGLSASSARFFRSSTRTLGGGPVFGWKMRTAPAWRVETGASLFAFNRY